VRDTLFNFFDFDCKIKWPNDILLDGKNVEGVAAYDVAVKVVYYVNRYFVVVKLTLVFIAYAVK